MKYREVASAQAEQAWDLRVLGGFSLVAPGGRPIEFRNRKCEGLIAVLATCRPHGMRRDLAAQALWPEKPVEQRQESLRQAIAIIRRLTGPDFLFTDRTHCGLAEDQAIRCDYDNAEMDKSLVFMPAQTGEWFESLRMEMALTSETTEETSVMSHCLEFLRWSARWDPKGVYAFFRINRYLVRGLSFGDVLAILDSAGRPEGVCGWADYWRGCLEDDLDRCALHLRRALASAVREPDWELASEVCFELGKVYARRGDSVNANRICKAAEEVAERSGRSSAKINALRLKGTLLVHRGHMQNGLELLRHSADQIDEPVRRMVVESTQALFEAMSGRFASAARSLEIGEALAREAGHQQARLLTSLTRALLSAREGPRLHALPLLDDTARSSYGAGVRQLGVYADEVAAKLLLLDKDRRAAKYKLDSANKNRLQARMARTSLESNMVAAVQ